MKKRILATICFLCLSGIAVYSCQSIPKESESTGLSLNTSINQNQKTQTSEAVIEAKEGQNQNRNLKEIVTAESSLPVFTSVDRQVVTLESDPRSISYTVYHQGGINESEELSSYVSWHGCAACSASTILTAFTEETVLPDRMVEEIEIEVFGKEIWEKNYEKSLERQMPLSLYGVSRILEYFGVKEEYVRTFKDKEASRQITKHLAEGKPVIAITSSINRSKKKHSGSAGYHTTIFLGFTDTGKVVIADPAGESRITYSTIEELIPYMFPCKDLESTGCYFNGRERCGGYILVEPQ